MFRTETSALNWVDLTNNLMNRCKTDPMTMMSRCNKHFYSLRRHEKAGAIYVSAAGLLALMKKDEYGNDLALQGGVFRWNESTQQWTCLTNPKPVIDLRIWNVMEFNVHPDDSNRLFIGLQGGSLVNKGVPPEGQYGSAVRVQYDPINMTSTVDDLKVPLLALNYHSSVQVFGAFFPPHDPNTTFITSTSHGIWYSADGAAWEEYKVIPHLRVQRRRWFQDANAEPVSLLVSTFGGGAWKIDRLCFVINDLSKFSSNQVAATLAIKTPALFPQAFYVVFEGYAPAGLGFSANTLTQPPPRNLAPKVDLILPDDTISMKRRTRSGRPCARTTRATTTYPTSRPAPTGCAPRARATTSRTSPPSCSSWRA